MVKPVGTPEYIYNCDLCHKEEKGGWHPPNWTTMSIAVLGAGAAQLNICQECLKKPMVMLVNKVATTAVATFSSESGK